MTLDDFERRITENDEPADGWLTTFAQLITSQSTQPLTQGAVDRINWFAERMAIFHEAERYSLSFGASGINVTFQWLAGEDESASTSPTVLPGRIR